MNVVTRIKRQTPQPLVKPLMHAAGRMSGCDWQDRLAGLGSAASPGSTRSKARSSADASTDDRLRELRHYGGCRSPARKLLDVRRPHDGPHRLPGSGLSHREIWATDRRADRARRSDRGLSSRICEALRHTCARSAYAAALWASRW